MNIFNVVITFRSFLLFHPHLSFSPLAIPSLKCSPCVQNLPLIWLFGSLHFPKYVSYRICLPFLILLNPVLQTCFPNLLKVSLCSCPVHIFTNSCPALSKTGHAWDIPRSRTIHAKDNKSIYTCPEHLFPRFTKIKPILRPMVIISLLRLIHTNNKRICVSFTPWPPRPKPNHRRTWTGPVMSWINIFPQLYYRINRRRLPDWFS